MANWRDATVVRADFDEAGGGSEFSNTADVRLSGGAVSSAQISNAIRRAADLSPDMTICPLLSGQSVETYTASNCTRSDDATNKIIGPQGAKLTTVGAVTASFRRDFSGGMEFGAAQAVGITVWIDDPTKITSIGATIYLDSGITVSWGRSVTTGLVAGWNYLRLSAVDGLTAQTALQWGTAHRVYFSVVTNAATWVTLGQMYAECRRKASMIFINDGPYEQFIREIYPQLKARGYPLTLACDPGIHGTGTGIDMRATEAQILEIATDGNGNEVSMHGWLGDPTSAKTAAEIIIDTRKAQEYLLQRGQIDGAIWRAAWTQNQATNASAADPYLIAYASAVSDANPFPWPPTRPRNIGRWAMFNQTAQQQTDLIGRVTACKCAMVAYCHAVAEGSVNNATPAEWASFLSIVDAAVAAGTLEVVTFGTLFRRSGGTITRTAGSYTATWPLPDGTTNTVIVG